MIPMSVETLTDFLRRPNKALRRVEKEDVVLSRRGKTAIRISLESRTKADLDRNELASHLLADALAEMPELPARLAGLLEKRYSWLRFLPLPAREEFVRELVQTIEAFASVGKVARIEEVVAGWKATAEIYAEPELAAKLMEPLPGTNIAVRRP